jgi:GNAT superfamily N-acetyltransferase
MNDLRLRVMTDEDISFANSLRALAGWNQTIADWRRFIALEPNGCFLAEYNGAPAGTATTIRYGDKIAWIGMVLVHPGQRRHGIGRALLSHCIDYLKTCRIQSIILDATPLGQKLYETLGFEPEWTLTRWRGVVTEATPKPLPKIDLPKIAKLDAAAFGADRTELLTKVAANSQTAYLEDAGFAMLRKGAHASYLGPVVATAPHTAIQLIESILPPGEFIIDIPDHNQPAIAWAKNKGFTAERQLTRMRLGKEIRPTAPQTLFAIAAPEIG